MKRNVIYSIVKKRRHEENSTDQNWILCNNLKDWTSRATILYHSFQFHLQNGTIWEIVIAVIRVIPACLVTDVRGAMDFEAVPNTRLIDKSIGESGLLLAPLTLCWFHQRGVIIGGNQAHLCVLSTLSCQSSKDSTKASRTHCYSQK